jgi:hypothetical protein
MRSEFIFAAVLGVVQIGCDFLQGGTYIGSADADAPPIDGGSVPTDGAPLIDSAPDAWVASDCGGVGNVCSMMSCGPAGQCQAGLDVCVPLAGPRGFPGQSQQTPYCIAATCMTYAQASCFCLGPAGAQFDSCALGPQGVVGICGSEGSSCANRGCCAGLKCVKDSPTTGTCYRACSTGTDCSSGCCTDLKSTGDMECAPATACQTPCTPQGSSCDGTSHCCNGTCVTGSTVADFVGCRPSCFNNSDCFSGCCQAFANSGGGFCVDARHCGCAAVGSDCSGGVACCPGSSCGVYDGGTATCYQNCNGAGDCDAGCCTTHLANVTYGICAPCR